MSESAAFGQVRRTRRLARAACALWLPVVLVAASARPAAASGETALAETLYRSARELMAAGKYAEACPKFAESYRLDSATGTLLNLAACHEAQGKTASAWVEYMDAAAAAERDGRDDRVRYAEERSRALFPNLSQLTIALTPGLDPATIKISIDGAVLGAAAIGVPAPLDPGSHVVKVEAQGKKPFTQTIELGPVADRKTVTIPVLEDAPPEPVAAAPVAAGAAAAATAGKTPADPPKPAAPVKPAPAVPTSVIVTGSVTLGLAVASIVTGVMYMSRREDYEAQQPTAENRDSRKADYDAAQTLGAVNTGLLIATAGGAALTGFLFFTKKESSPAPRAVSLAVGKGFAGVSAAGEF